ncbi:MAG: hypothetical protein KKE94_09845, partial [Gammaproteobacteria bacterium]|nr:hypothetical protein [Gammaproteobacteria bacterium]
MNNTLQQTPVSAIKGVGSKVADKLNKLGIVSM